MPKYIIIISIMIISQMIFSMEKNQDSIIQITTHTEKDAEVLAKKITLFLRDQKDETFQNLFVDILKRPIKGHIYPNLPEKRKLYTERLLRNPLMRESATDLSEYVKKLREENDYKNIPVMDAPVPD